MPTRGHVKERCLRGHRRTAGRCLTCEREAAARRRKVLHARPEPRRRAYVPRDLPIQIGATPAQMAMARLELARWEAEQQQPRESQRFGRRYG